VRFWWHKYVFGGAKKRHPCSGCLSDVAFVLPVVLLHLSAFRMHHVGVATGIHGLGGVHVRTVAFVYRHLRLRRHRLTDVLPLLGGFTFAFFRLVASYSEENQGNTCQNDSFFHKFFSFFDCLLLID
jgi:hypothetical protein